MAFAARLALLCAFAPFVLGAARPAGDLPSFVARMRTASGPVWKTHFVSVSRLNLAGETTLVSSESQGPAFLVRRCSGELCQGTYFDGARLHSVNLNATTLLLSSDPEPYLHALRLIASLEFLSPAFAAHGGRLEDAGMATFAGRRYRQLYISDTTGLPLRLYVDPATALLRYARDFGGRDTFEYTNYRHSDGFAVPYEIRHNGDVLERYDDRTAVTSPFHAPHGLVASFAGPPQAIPTDPNHVTPIVDCTLGGVATRCLIDSGNSGLSISSELAARLQLNVLGTFRVRGLGDYSTQVVQTGPLLVGNAAFPAAYYVVLSDISRYGYDVVLGADFLATTAVDIDAGTHTVRLDQPAPAQAIAIPLSFENSVPVVTVHLGDVDAALAVDTGDESDINLAYGFYAKHAGLFAVTQRRLVSGIGGTSVELMGDISEVAIGDHQFGRQRIGTTKTLAGTAFGHLGAAFLRQFDVQFDYAAAELHLTPR